VGRLQHNFPIDTAPSRAKKISAVTPPSNHPRRPPRITPFQNLQPLYFVTFNTHARRAILAYPEIFEAFTGFSTRAHLEHQIAVGRFVIMPDHIHLFVILPPSGPSLPSWIKSLKAVLGKTLLQSGIPKPHWQEGFFDHLMRSAESYDQKWEYVLANPVRAGLAATPDEWPFQGEITRIER
jgi:REP element-mobilizing transposase RayT